MSRDIEGLILTYILDCWKVGHPIANLDDLRQCVDCRRFICPICINISYCESCCQPRCYICPVLLKNMRKRKYSPETSWRYDDQCNQCFNLSVGSCTYCQAKQLSPVSCAVPLCSAIICSPCREYSSVVHVCQKCSSLLCPMYSREGRCC